MSTNPVSIRQIDTDSCCRIKITCKDSSSNHFSRYPFHLFFLERFINRRMIFKPLRVTADNLRTMCRFQIFEVHQRFPTRFHPQRVAVTFSKSIHKIYSWIQVFHPKNSIFIEIFQIACFIELNQLGDNGLLRLILCHTFRFLQPINNLLNSLCIESAYFPNLLCQLSVFFYQATVQSVRNRCFVFRVFHITIKTFCLFLRHSIVIVTSRGQYKIFAIRLVYPLRHNCRIENHREQLGTELIGSLPFLQRKQLGIQTEHGLFQEFLWEVRHKFLRTIVMMNTIGEPYPFQVHLHVFKIRRRFIPLIVCIYCFEHPTDSQIIFSILVKQNIPSFQSSLCQVINQFLLFQRQFLKSGNLITQYL